LDRRGARRLPRRSVRAGLRRGLHLSPASGLGARLGSGPPPELLLQALGAGEDLAPNAGRLDDLGLTSVGEDLADEVLHASEAQVLEGVALREWESAPLHPPAAESGGEEDARRARVREFLRHELRARLERLVEEVGALHAVDAEAALGVLRPVPAVRIPPGELALEGVRLDHADARLLADRGVLDLDEAVLGARTRERRDEVLLGCDRLPLGPLVDVELAERLLELAAHALQGSVRFGGDHGADELEGEPDRARLQRRQPRRAAERVAEELFLDIDLVTVERRVHGVTAAAEVHEVEELEVVVELVRRNLEALDELVGRDARRRGIPAACEKECEQRLEDAEALGGDGTGRPFERLGLLARGRRPRRLGRLAVVELDDLVDPVPDERHEL